MPDWVGNDQLMKMSESSRGVDKKLLDNNNSTQAPFTNVTLDWTVPADLKDRAAIVGGKEMDFTYGDCKKEMDMVNKAFLEIMIEGDANGRGFQYPMNVSWL